MCMVHPSFLFIRHSTSSETIPLEVYRGSCGLGHGPQVAVSRPGTPHFHILSYLSVTLRPSPAKVSLTPFWVDFNFITTPFPFFMAVAEPPATKAAPA